MVHTFRVSWSSSLPYHSMQLQVASLRIFVIFCGTPCSFRTFSNSLDLHPCHKPDFADWPDGCHWVTHHVLDLAIFAESQLTCTTWPLVPTRPSWPSMEMWRQMSTRSRSSWKRLWPLKSKEWPISLVEDRKESCMGTRIIRVKSYHSLFFLVLGHHP